MFGCYIKERERERERERENTEMVEGCELWGGNKRKKGDGWGGMYVCDWGEEKRKAGGTWVVGKRKKEIKKKK